MSETTVTIKLKSNIILKSIYKKHNYDMSYITHLPVDLLSKEYIDVRGHIYLSETQKREIDKRLYYAERVEDVENILDESDLKLLNGVTLLDHYENPANKVDQSLEFDVYDVFDSSLAVSQSIDDDMHVSQKADNSSISETHPVVETVLNSYQFDKCFLNRQISDLVNELDNANNYSKQNNNREVTYCIDKIRESYRKVMHIILDHLTGKNMRTYGEYFKPLNSLELERIFKLNGINMQIKNDLEKFHILTNAIGHNNEKGSNRFANKNTIDDFFSLSIERREKILLSVPIFLSLIKLTNAEKKSLSNKL